jgi:anti-sigma regulatory factor (Ser/Thr protein kinase)
MNAIEHGNRNRPELPVEVRVAADDHDVKVRITDQGGERAIPEVEAPDLEAKLAGLQTPRGWGLFLIQNMVDRLETTVDQHHHTIELTMHLKEAPDARS